MSLRKEWDLANDRTFAERVPMALYRVAREVIEESPDVWGHPERLATARAFIQQDAETFVRYAALAVTDDDIQAIIAAKVGRVNESDVPDTMLMVAVRRMWNTMSNVQLPSNPPAPGSGV